MSYNEGAALVRRIREKGATISRANGKVSVTAAHGIIDVRLRSEMVEKKDALLDCVASWETDGYPRLTCTPLNVEETYPLSSAQSRLWFYDRSVPHARATYNLPLVLGVDAGFTVPRIDAALQNLLARHQVLAAFIALIDGEPRLKVDVKLRVSTREVTCATRAAALKQAQWIAEQPFDLERGPLLSSTLIRYGVEAALWVLSIHHILCDGWSMNLIAESFLESFYGQSATTPREVLQYPIYALWEQRCNQEGAFLEQERYWQRQLAGIPDQTSLPTDYERGITVDYSGDTLDLVIDAVRARRIAEYCVQHKATLHHFLLSLFYLLLRKYSNQHDFVVGSSFWGRNHESLRDTVGFFVNTLPLRVRLRDSDTFDELIAQVRGICLDAHVNQDLAFDKIVSLIDVPRSASRSPVFQTMFDMQNFVDILATKKRFGAIETVSLPTASAKYELTLAMYEVGDEIHGVLEYQTALFSDGSMRRVVQTFMGMIDEVCKSPGAPVGRLCCCIGDDLRSLLVRNDAATYAYDRELHLQSRIDRQAARTPHAIAAVCGEDNISYGELSQRSTQLAQLLYQKGLKADQCVVTLMDRGLDYLVTNLGILKAGGAFVPVEKNRPAAFIQDVIKDCRCEWVICDEDLGERLPGGSAQIIFSAIPFDTLPEQSQFDCPATADSLCYVMYTSGSTGKPKGVMIEHAGMTNHILAQVRSLELGPDDVVGQIAIASFDVAVWQCFAALVVGGRTHVLLSEDAWVPSRLCRAIQSHRITILQSVPSHTQIILDEIEYGSTRYDLSSLRFYNTHGEPLPVAQYERWCRLVPSAVMINAYGATEVSDDSSHFHLRPAMQFDRAVIPITGLLNNNRFYALDSYQEQVPVGGVGELYIGGEGVGRGYLSNPALTAEKFVADPFSRVAGARMYRTGDGVRLRADGAFEFFGRVDLQVKIRGMRVDLTQVEHAMTTHPLVLSAATRVIARSDTEQYVIGYAVCRGFPAPSSQEIRKYLAALLPDYMIPSYVVPIDRMPTLPNGKLDRRALPEVDLERAGIRERFAAPQTELQIGMVQLWSQLLGVHPIGLNDNFFKLGGNSLKAAEFSIKSAATLGIEIPIRAVFEGQTIGEIAARVTQTANGCDPSGLARAIGLVFHEPRDEWVPLAPAQVPVWYACKMRPDSIVYNTNESVLILRGPLDAKLFVEAWERFLNRHRVFSLRLSLRNGVPMQRYGEAIVLDHDRVVIDLSALVHRDLSHEMARRAYEYGLKPFALEDQPLFRFNLVRYNDNGQQVCQPLFCVHHLIWDETSTMIAFQEVFDTYRSLCAGEEPSLPELTYNYLDYARWMNNVAQSDVLKDSRRYWEEQFRHLPESLRLPTDYPRPAIQTYNGAWAFSWLSRSSAAKLTRLLDRERVSLFMFGLAVLNAYLYRATGQDDIVMGCPVQGRGVPEFKNVVGLFATPLPLRCKINAAGSFAELLELCREVTLKGFDNQLYPCNKLIEGLGHTGDLSRPRLFSIMYGLQNNKTSLLDEFQVNGIDKEICHFQAADDVAGARFDLNFIIDQFGDDIALNCIYNTDLFRAETVEQMLQSCGHLIDHVLEESRTSLQKLPLLDAASVRQVFEGLPTPVDSTRTVADIMEAAFASYADRVAIEYGAQTRTFTELRQDVLRLRSFLQTCGCVRGDRICIGMEPGPTLVALFAAAVCMGISYVPVATNIGADRLREIIAVSGVRLVILESSSVPSGVAVGQFVPASSLQSGSLAAQDELAPSLVTASDEMYVMFTSGTTGRPKGIPIDHRGVVNLLESTQQAYRLGAHDKVLWLSSAVFDASILEIYWPLMTGTPLVIPERAIHNDVAKVAQLIDTTGVTFFQCVPSFLDELCHARAAQRISSLESVRLVISGGEALSRRVCESASRLFAFALFNHYGPTEVCVDAARFDCSLPFHGEGVPIGRGIRNVGLLILDEHLQVVPPGFEGQLYVVSPGLSRGYLGQARSDAFVEIARKGVTYRAYATGDRCKSDREGIVYFVGRLDDQIKLLGNRIEPQDIAANLESHRAIARSVVTAATHAGRKSSSLIAVLELEESVNQFVIAGHRYRLVTVAQNPGLRRHLDTLCAQAWPAYFAGDLVMKEYGPRLYLDYPEYQFALVEEVTGRIAAAGNCLPYRWSGHRDDLPAGSSAVLADTFASATTTLSEISDRDALLMLSAVVEEGFKGRGLIQGVLEAFKAVAIGFGLGRCIALVRPSGAVVDPKVDFGDWVVRRRADGQLDDRWLRAHERVGGKVLCLALRSQEIRGSLDDWRCWAGQHVFEGGTYVLPGMMRPVTIDIRQNIVSYFEPAVWIEHRLDNVSHRGWMHVDRLVCQGYLAERLPAYMLPQQFTVIARMPILPNGKIDIAQARQISVYERTTRIPPRSDLEQLIAKCWCEVLGIPADQVDVEDSFFAVGGNSLRAVRLLEQIKSMLGVTVPLLQFYKQPTIRSLSALVGQVEGAER